MKLVSILIVLFYILQTFGANVNKDAAATKSDSKNLGLSRKQNIDPNSYLDDDDMPIRISLPTALPIDFDFQPPMTKKYKISSTPKATTSKKPSHPTTVKVTTTTKNTKTASTITQKSLSKNELICPNDSQAEFQLFPLRCKKNNDCKRLGGNYRCCKQHGLKICTKGIFKPLEEQKHEPIFGVIARKCPKEPLAEFWWQLQTCDTDRDCWPRVCCPDGQYKYCRTAVPEFESSKLPVARQLSYPFEAVSGYLQCTPPPPPVFDAHPKPCNNTLDCFPNVCCQESGKKHCRPPKRSLLALLATMTQRFNTGFIKQWTDNLVIR